MLFGTFNIDKSSFEHYIYGYGYLGNGYNGAKGVRRVFVSLEIECFLLDIVN
jgi:hypothetical protein